MKNTLYRPFQINITIKLLEHFENAWRVMGTKLLKNNEKKKN